jgi:hypothetical protein
MRFGNVTTDDIPVPFLDVLLLSNYPDAPTTAASRWLHDVHVTEVTQLTVLDKTLVVLWENVSGWCNIKISAVMAFHALDVSPQVVLATYAPRACEVVDLLITVQVLYATLLEEARPADVPV